MFIDITLKITTKMIADAQSNEKIVFSGHLGTHFDVMNKEFPLDYFQREAIIFDVSHISDRDIEIADILIEQVHKNMFVAFYSGFMEKESYGTKTYFKNHPQISYSLIEELVKKGVSIIGIDFAGIRRGKEHTPADQYCADRGIFVVENLSNLSEVLTISNKFQAYTSPMNFTDMTGLPCRVIAKL